VTTADLTLYELTGDTAYNPFLLDGDVVSVPHADVVATITGAVRRPGSYELVKSKDLSELLELAGGFTSSVARDLPIRVMRRNERQQAVFTDLPFTGGSTPNQALKDDDDVTVRGAIELQRSVLSLLQSHPQHSLKKPCRV
jgi:protein involved in polysaccharide export with SLBB domain